MAAIESGAEEVVEGQKSANSFGRPEMIGYAFGRSATAELQESIAYYNQERAGLGKEFAAAVDAGMDEVLEHPHRWPVLSGNTRRYRLKRFPHGLVYRIVPGGFSSWP